MIINVCGRKVSTVYAGWLGLLFSALIILPCLMALTFADDLTRRIMDIPDVNCRVSYDKVLHDVTTLCKISVILAILSMVVSCCLIIELDRFVVPVSWRRVNSTRIDSVIVFNIADSATAAESKSKKSENLEKFGKLEKLEKLEKSEKTEKSEISIV
ncbi:uncharacterized protein LOC101454659 [Ceratitis capitata]|uniref:(Mediterranean fruit fly) hypothetical protein n=1 Tax=Ceratitis capitata TaxID=7213 RepID=A0A811VDJ8_CERCA|nr:uncharacterized protein LOC101454659 [Ceratitis capitata]CAD7012293.1 unnamed protein product [Ceratitis capitata]